MLTFAATKNVAFTDGYGEYFCMPCAAQKWGALYVAKIDAGLADEPKEGEGGPHTVIEYNMDQRTSEYAYERASEDADNGEFEQDSEEFDKAVEVYERCECDGGCGRVYTGGAIPWQEPQGDADPVRVRTSDDNRWH